MQAWQRIDKSTAMTQSLAKDSTEHRYNTARLLDLLVRKRGLSKIYIPNLQIWGKKYKFALWEILISLAELDEKGYLEGLELSSDGKACHVRRITRMKYAHD